MKTATYTTGKVDSDGMVRIIRNGKAVGWADEDDAEATIEEMRQDDRAEYVGGLQERIAGLVEGCEDPETLEAVLRLLRG